MYVSLNLSLPALLMLLSRTGLMGRVAGSIKVSDVTHYMKLDFSVIQQDIKPAREMYVVLKLTICGPVLTDNLLVLMSW